MGWFTQLRLQKLPITNIETALLHLSPMVRSGVLERIEKAPKKYCTEYISLMEADFGNTLSKRLIQTAGHFAIWKRSGPVLVLLISPVPIANSSTPKILYTYAFLIRTALVKWEHYDIFTAQWELEEEIGEETARTKDPILRKQLQELLEKRNQRWAEKKKKAKDFFNIAAKELPSVSEKFIAGFGKGILTVYVIIVIVLILRLILWLVGYTKNFWWY